MDRDITCLQACINRYLDSITGLSEIENSLQSETRGDVIALYEKCYPLLERAMWNDEAPFDDLLECYQSLFREQEALLQSRGDERYHFILSIPVADRPAHLKNCLESIYQLCRLFGYGGIEEGVYRRIQIIVAEDSREPKSIQRHIDLVAEYRAKGLQVSHFGQSEQYELLHSLTQPQRERLGSILTTLPRERFYLKGQAANRNLSYLKCLQLTEDKRNTLYYMVDSDQSFCVNRLTGDGDRIVYALNYFYVIDKVFRTTDTLMLTGKLVGDPPVSPSVMTGNFLDDVNAFFASLAETRQEQSCHFHTMPDRTVGDAAYHDMANLFGFENRNQAYPYRCRLTDWHDNRACLQDFSRRLNGFFSGEHLTRKTYYRYRGGCSELSPARTVYPGNYIVNYEGLKYVIPFGDLRLRMSGPTAGRLIAAEIQERFASANIPHLHRRTSEGGLSDDFRPGVELRQESGQPIIDLGNEFERQFFGDLMLFSAEVLVKRADVGEPFPESLVLEVVRQKESELLELYQQKRRAIGEKAGQLEDRVFRRGGWWLECPESEEALERIKVFMQNIRHNYGEQSQAWRQIQSVDHREQRRLQIVDALVNYRATRNAWDCLFA